MPTEQGTETSEETEQGTETSEETVQAGEVCLVWPEGSGWLLTA